jgi:hypothetical protein
MAWWIGVCLAVILLIVLILITKIHVTVHYHHHRDDDSLTIRFRAWRIIGYTYQVPMIAFDEESTSIFLKQKKKAPNAKQQTSEKKITKDDILTRIKRFQRLLKNIDGLHRAIKRFLNRMSINRLEWYTRFGLGDAAWTGMAIGAIWVAKGNIIGLIAHYMRLVADPEISVEPVWQLDDSETDLSCMISFRVGHAMGAGIQIVKFW